MAVLASALPATASAAEAAPPESQAKRVLSKVHTDAIAVFSETGQLVLGTKADVDGVFGKRLDPASTIFNVEEETRLQVPDNAQYAFLGAAGSDVWIAPETNPGGTVLWPGFNTEAVPSGLLDGNRVQINLTNVTGPGTVNLFQTPFTGPRRLLSSQGDAYRTYALSAGQHVHANWAFSASGTYVLTVTASGTVGGAPVSSAPVDYTFHVGAIQPAAATATTLSASASAVTAGSPVTLTAAVSPAAATGWVEFFDGSSSLGHTAVTDGVAALTTSALPLGARTLTATYTPTWTNEFSSSTSAATTVTVRNADTGVLVVEGVKASYSAGETLRARAAGITPAEDQSFRWIIEPVAGGTSYVMADVGEAPYAELVRELTTSYDGWRISVELRQGNRTLQESAAVPLVVAGPNVGSGAPLTLAGLAGSYLEGEWAELTATHAPLQEGQAYRWVMRNPRTSAVWEPTSTWYGDSFTGTNPFNVYVQNFGWVELALQIVDADGRVVAQSASFTPTVKERELLLSGKQTVYRAGQAIRLSAELYPADERFRWQWSLLKPGGTELQVIEGATSSTLDLTADMSLDKAQVFVSVLEPRGGQWVRSASTTLAVTDAAPSDPVLFFDALSGHYHQGGTIAFTLN
ncbi:choice-of-anchor M domain-containing protein, partial [Motilibacter deserti]